LTVNKIQIDPSDITKRSSRALRSQNITPQGSKTMKGLLKLPTRKFKCESIKIFKKNHNNGLENNYNIISK
jgi:hypothetical protein